MSYGHIMWRAERARLKSFAGATRADGALVIKVEIETTDAYEFGSIIEALQTIKKSQEEARKEAVRKARSPRGRAASDAPSDEPLLLEDSEPLLLEDRRGRDDRLR